MTSVRDTGRAAVTGIEGLHLISTTTVTYIYIYTT